MQRSAFGAGTHAVHLSRLPGLARSTQMSLTCCAVWQAPRRRVVRAAPGPAAAPAVPPAAPRGMQASAGFAHRRHFCRASSTACLAVPRLRLSVVALVRIACGALCTTCAGLTRLHFLQHRDIEPVQLAVNGRRGWFGVRNRGMVLRCSCCLPAASGLKTAQMGCKPSGGSSSAIADAEATGNG